MSPLAKLSASKAEKYRGEWLEGVHQLAQQVHGWAEEQGWTVTEDLKEIHEDRLGTYEAPLLKIDTPRGQLLLEPIARDVAGGEGRVDFSVWPSLYQVMLIRDAAGNWVVRTQFGPKWPHSWGKETFKELAEGLLDEV